MLPVLRAGLATKPQGQTYEVGDPNIVARPVREPIGVLRARSSSWNYPLLMAAWQSLRASPRATAASLSLGTYTLSAVRLFNIDQVGFPPGVAQLVLGAGIRPAPHSPQATASIDRLHWRHVHGWQDHDRRRRQPEEDSLELGGKNRMSFSPMPILPSPLTTLCLPSAGREKFAAPDRG
jgi:betaine-aldehyde dehydrogenase